MPRPKTGNDYMVCVRLPKDYIRRFDAIVEVSCADGFEVTRAVIIRRCILTGLRREEEMAPQVKKARKKP